MEICLKVSAAQTKVHNGATFKTEAPAASNLDERLRRSHTCWIWEQGATSVGRCKADNAIARGLVD